MHDLISGIHALHENDILHLDIKPENLLFESMASDAKIKITDFGLSKVFHDSEEVRRKEPTIEELEEKTKAFIDTGILQREKLRGTVGYMSPELILLGVQSKATDIWAAGVVLYILLCGYPPFHSKSNREILEKSAKGVYVSPIS
jgi:serine/threonine protein kinase